MRLSNELTRVQSAGMTIAVERCIVSRDLTEPKLSPDGRCVVFVVAAGGSAALYIDTLDGRTAAAVECLSATAPGTGFRRWLLVLERRRRCGDLRRDGR